MTQFNKIVVFSGHMIDSPDRNEPRFPSSKEKIVAKRVINQLNSWSIGANDLAICSGACGGDILFAEACVESGVTVKLHLPLPETEFIERSVRVANLNWEERYIKLTRHPKVNKCFLQDYQSEFSDDISVFAQNNLWMIKTATQKSSEGNLFALLVWDEKSTGDGQGGTSDFARTIQESGGQIAIINPTKL